MRKEWTIQEENRLKFLSGSKSFQKMSEEDFINRTPTALQKKSIKIGLSSNFSGCKKHFHDINFWKNPNILNSYWAGFIAADGNLASSRKSFCIQIHKKDEHQLELLKEHIKYTGEIKYYKGYPTLNIACGNEWYKDLAEIWSIVPNKTYILEPPKIKDPELIKAYLCGFISGDGWITERDSKKLVRLGMCNASLSFLEWIKNKIEALFPRHGKLTNLITKEIQIKKSNQGNYYNIHIDGIRALVIINELRQMSLPLMDRKWNKPKIIEYIKFYKEKYPQIFI